MRKNDPQSRDWAVIVLAIAIGTSLNCITFAVLYDAIFSSDSGLSENATQVITGAFGGILGVLGTYLGVKTGEQVRESQIDRNGKPGVEPLEEAPDP